MNMARLIDEQAERAVLGCLVLNEKIAFMHLTEQNIKLDPEWFTLPIHKAMARAVLDLRHENKPVDIITVSNLMNTREDDISVTELGAMGDLAVSAHNIAYHSEIVRDLAIKRQQRDIILKAVEDIESEMTSQDVLASIMTSLQGTQIVGAERTAEAIGQAIITDIDTTIAKGHSGLPSKWLAYTAKLGQYRRGKVYILAARTSVGKTTFALNEVENWLLKGYRVGVISLETSAEDIFEQVTGIRYGLDLFKMREGFTSKMVEQFKKGLAEVIKLPLFVSDRNMNIYQIKNWIQTQVYKNKVDVVVLDYVQIISELTSDRKKNVYDKVSMYSRELFEVAKLTNIPILVLCQINRAGEAPHGVKDEDRWKYTPRLHHLKESGKLEEDAYAVTILYNDPQTYQEGMLTVPLVVDLAKHRRGPVGKIQLVYEKPLQQMTWHSM